MLKKFTIAATDLTDSGNRSPDEAIARLGFGQHGLTVLVAARNLQAAEAAADTLQKEGLKAEAIALDVNNSDQIQSAVREIGWRRRNDGHYRGSKNRRRIGDIAR